MSQLISKYKIWNDLNCRRAVIPLGVALNRKYKVGKGKFYSSKEDVTFKRFIDSMKYEFRSIIDPIPALRKGKRFIDKNVIMMIDVYDESNRPDIDAIEKSVMDAMSGILYENDRQIWSKTTVQMLDPKNPRVEIRCYPEKRY